MLSLSVVVATLFPGVFPDLGAGLEKGGCGASNRSASAASFNLHDSVISEYETKATTRRTDRAVDDQCYVKDVKVRHQRFWSLSHAA